MSEARAAVLAALRCARAPARALAPWTPPPAPDALPLREALARALEGVGGRLAVAPGPHALGEALESLPCFAGARRVASALPGVARANVDAGTHWDARDLDGLDVAVVPGRLAVAENGAVWVDGAALPHRALLWLAEHLVLVVPADAVVPDLHAAYARLRFDGPGFGVFVAGPSKTADIEQALVFGAQGPRTTTLVLAGTPPT